MANKITYMGVSRTLQQWAVEWDIPYNTLYKRLRRNPNISLDALFSKDLHEHRRQIEIRQLCDICLFEDAFPRELIFHQTLARKERCICCNNIFS